MNIKELLDKRIVILGLGKEGLSLVEFFCAHGAKNLTVADKRDLQELPKVDGLLKQKINFRTGPGYLSGLDNFDIILRSPGVSSQLPEIRFAVKKGAKLLTMTELFFELCPAEIIGVSGTKGKGTTSALIAKILSADKKHPVHLAGNIGVPMLDILPKIKKTDRVVLELSSFQLEDLTCSPHVAVLLNIVPEHLDHHQTFRHYVSAKANLIRFQTEKDIMVSNLDYPLLIRLSRQSRARKVWVSGKTLGPGKMGAYREGSDLIYSDGKERELVITRDRIKIRGEHNLENILPAICVGRLYGINSEKIADAIAGYKGLPHRLEFVKKVNAVEFYDDSIATTPDSAIAASRAFSGALAIILGGSGKTQRFDGLARELARRANTSVVLIGASASKVAQALEKFGRNVSYKFAGSMPEAVSKAYEAVKKDGGTVVLAPADASFDMYANYEERGEDFKRQVNKI